jgi:hypothetical protein
MPIDSIATVTIRKALANDAVLCWMPIVTKGLRGFILADAAFGGPRFTRRPRAYPQVMTRHVLVGVSGFLNRTDLGDDAAYERPG